MKTFSRNSSVHISSLSVNEKKLIDKSSKTIEHIKNKYKNDTHLNYINVDSDFKEDKEEYREGNADTDKESKTESETDSESEIDTGKGKPHGEISYVGKNAMKTVKSSAKSVSSFISKYKNLSARGKTSIEENAQDTEEINSSNLASKSAFLDNNSYNSKDVDHDLMDNTKNGKYYNFKKEYSNYNNDKCNRKLSNKHSTDTMSSKRKFYALDELITNRHVDLEMYESLYVANKKHSHSRQSSENILNSSNKNIKEKNNGNILINDYANTKKENEKMSNYELYKNNMNNGDYLSSAKAGNMKNMFLRNEDNRRRNEENKETSYNFPYSNRTYKEKSNSNSNNNDTDSNNNHQDVLFKNNIRYNSSAVDIPNHNNSNKIDMHLLYNNDIEKLNSNLSAYNDSNKLSELQEKYKNNFLYEKEYPNHINDERGKSNNKGMKDNTSLYSNHMALYSNDENSSKNELRSNYLNNVISNRNTKEENFTSEKKDYNDKELDPFKRFNFNNDIRNKASNESDMNNRKKKILENLMNIKSGGEDKGETNFDVNDMKSNYVGNFYKNKNGPNWGYRNGPNWGYKNGPILDHKNDPILDHNNGPILDHKNEPNWGYKNSHHKRSSSSNVHIGRHEVGKVNNYLNYADDTQAKISYYNERDHGPISGYEKYLQQRNDNRSNSNNNSNSNDNNGNSNRNCSNVEDHFSSDINLNELNANTDLGGEMVDANINANMANIANIVNVANDGDKNNDGNNGKQNGNGSNSNTCHDLASVRNHDIIELRKKQMNNFNNNVGNETKYLGKKETYMDDKSENYNLGGGNEKNKMHHLINNYEDLFSFDKNIKKKNDIKNIVCVCQASKQMARLQLHMEESRQMLETEKSLLKKKRENFEKKVELLAEKEKEIDKIHSQIKEKEISIDKKKNEIEEKEKYVNSIKSKYDNAQKELLDKMNECITIENKCKSKLYEYDEKFGQFNKKIKEMEEREREIENERKNMERKEKMLTNNKKEVEEEKLLNMKEKSELEMLKKELESLEKEKKKIIECEYSNLQNKEEELRRNERSNLIKENELKNRIDKYNELIGELNKNKKELENDKVKMMNDLQEERMKLLNEKNNLKKEKENEINYMKEELKKERMLMIEDVEKMKMIMLQDIENGKISMVENMEKEGKQFREELEKEKRIMIKNVEEEKEKWKTFLEDKYKESFENEKRLLEKQYEEQNNRLQNEIANEKKKIGKDRENFDKQRKIYEEEFRGKCEKYEESIQKKYEMLDEEKNKMKYLIMKEQEEVENYKKSVYLDIEEEKEKLYVQQEKLNLERENLLVEKEQIEIELKNYKNFKEKEENDIKIRIINLSQQQEDLNKEKENVEKEKEEIEKRKYNLDEREEGLNNDKMQMEESRKIFDEQLEKIKKNKEELLNYDKELRTKEIDLIEKEKEHNKKEDELNKKKEKLNGLDNELKDFSAKLQAREKKLKEKKNELQKVKDQLVNYKNGLKQKEVQFQMIEKREKELLDEQTIIQIDRSSLEAEKKQFLLMKEKHEKDTEYIQEQLKLLHEQLKNKEKSLKEKENEVNLLNKLQDCRSKSGKGAIISLKNLDNRKFSSNISRASNSKNRVKVKIIGKNKLDVIKRRNRKKSINFNYNNLEINNSIQYIDSMINENFKNKSFLKYKNNNLVLSEANFIPDQGNNDMGTSATGKVNKVDHKYLIHKMPNYESNFAKGDVMYNKIGDNNDGHLSNNVKQNMTDYAINVTNAMGKPSTSSSRYNVSNNHYANDSNRYTENQDDNDVASKLRSNFETDSYSVVHGYGTNNDTKRSAHDNYMNEMGSENTSQYKKCDGGMNSRMNEYSSNYKDLPDNADDANPANIYYAVQHDRNCRGDIERMVSHNYVAKDEGNNGEKTVKDSHMRGYKDNSNRDEHTKNGISSDANHSGGDPYGANSGNKNSNINRYINRQGNGHGQGRGHMDDGSISGFNNKRMNENNMGGANSYENNYGNNARALHYGESKAEMKKANPNNTHSNSVHANSYNINHLSTNIKMGNSNFNDTPNLKSAPRANFKENEDQENNKILESLNVNNLIESDLIEIKSNYGYSCDNPNGRYNDGVMIPENSEHKNVSMLEYNHMENESNRDIVCINKNINCINNDVDNINNNINNINDNLHKINSNVHGESSSASPNLHRNDNVREVNNNEGTRWEGIRNRSNGQCTNEGISSKNDKEQSSLSRIDSLVNQNMQSINHMSCLMKSSKKKKNSTLEKISGNIKNLNALKEAKKNKKDTFLRDDGDALKKESNFNEFLEEINPEKGFNSKMGEKTDEDFYYPVDKSLNDRNMSDSYEYKNKNNYGMAGTNNDQRKNNLLRKNNSSEPNFDASVDGHNGNRNRGGCKSGSKDKGSNNSYFGVFGKENVNISSIPIHNNMKILSDNGYSSDSNLVCNHNYMMNEEVNSRRLNSHAINYDGDSKLKLRNNSSNIYYNSNDNVLNYRNDDKHVMRSRKQEFVRENSCAKVGDKNELPFEQHGRSHEYDSNANDRGNRRDTEDRNSRDTREGGINENKNNMTYLKMSNLNNEPQPLRENKIDFFNQENGNYFNKNSTSNVNKYSSNLRNMDMNTKNLPNENRNVNMQKHSNSNSNSNNRVHGSSQHANKNTNMIRIKGFMHGLQNEKGNASSNGKNQGTERTYGNKYLNSQNAQENPAQGSSNNIIEQLDKTLLNKSIIMNKNKKKFNKKEYFCTHFEWVRMSYYNSLSMISNASSSINVSNASNASDVINASNASNI
ncbi:hypothetical protein, conserved [Plasmodium ovale curtisi]|uniref:Uncharacterized protein n=1 Tax=Plasmodium ovale curtisi TaxID=864141 RepID=A0A1A8X0Y8_PLAOA|nr:hypothetical protein, conserved [Plasmodium ovale curtisi]